MTPTAAQPQRRQPGPPRPALLSWGRKHLGLELLIILAQQTADLSGSLEACMLVLALQASPASTRAALAGVPLASRGSPLHLLQYESGRQLSPAGGGEGAWEKHPPVALAGHGLLRTRRPWSALLPLAVSSQKVNAFFLGGVSNATRPFSRAGRTSWAMRAFSSWMAGGEGSRRQHRGLHVGRVCGERQGLGYGCHGERWAGRRCQQPPQE